jgi:hypothetical protein
LGELRSAVNEALRAVRGNGEFLCFGIEEDGLVCGLGEWDASARGYSGEVKVLVVG